MLILLLIRSPKELQKRREIILAMGHVCKVWVEDASDLMKLLPHFHPTSVPSLEDYCYKHFLIQRWNATDNSIVLFINSRRSLSLCGSCLHSPGAAINKIKEAWNNICWQKLLSAIKLYFKIMFFFSWITFFPIHSTSVSEKLLISYLGNSPF